MVNDLKNSTACQPRATPRRSGIVVAVGLVALLVCFLVWSPLAQAQRSGESARSTQDREGKGAKGGAAQKSVASSRVEAKVSASKSAGGNVAGRNNNTAKNNKANRQGSRPVAMERELEAMAFAREHHPELADLLVQLRKANRPAYNAAIRELAQTSTRLTRMRERQPGRYENALSQWKLDSRIRLLAARLVMDVNPVLERELRKALEDRLDLRLEEMRKERAQLREKLERLEGSIARIETDRDSIADADLARLTGSLRVAAGKAGFDKRGKNRPGAEAKKKEVKRVLKQAVPVIAPRPKEGLKQ